MYINQKFEHFDDSPSLLMNIFDVYMGIACIVSGRMYNSLVRAFSAEIQDTIRMTCNTSLIFIRQNSWSNFFLLR